MRSSLWNLAGFGAPIAAALIAVPFVVRGLGVERFGILALAWAILGAAAMLDLGVGRALTQVVARRRATGEIAELNSLVMTATAFLGAVAIAAAAGLAPVKGTMVSSGRARAELVLPQQCPPEPTPAVPLRPGAFLACSSISRRLR